MRKKKQTVAEQTEQARKPSQQAIIFEGIHEEVDDEIYVTCPKCGNRDFLDAYDNIGLSEPEHLWCNNCGTELS